VKRGLHAFLLILGLLFVQLGAVAHAASHVSDKGLPSDTACELCVGYAQMAGSAPLPAQPVLPVCEARYQTPEAVVQFFYTRTIFHSRARAPPVHPV
jgi:hypothetical protein